jgi:hypothetical protein
MESIYINFEENRHFNPGLRWDKNNELQSKLFSKKQTKNIDRAYKNMSLCEFLNKFDGITTS